MTDREARWLERARSASRRPRPWVEYRCGFESPDGVDGGGGVWHGAAGRRSHLLATVHPIGTVPPMFPHPIVPGVHSVPPIELAVWLRAGTVTRETAERQSWSLPGEGTRVLLAESASIFNLSDDERPPDEWWVTCRDTVTTLSWGVLREAMFTAWRNQADTPVRRFVNRA